MDRVCHFEIPFDDKTRVGKFYQEVFGWQIQDAPGEMPYSFVITTPVNEQFEPTEPGGINGGMYPRGDEGGSKSPVVVIEVASCEQRIGDVETAGGANLMGPVVKDTEGNIIGLWQPLNK